MLCLLSNKKAVKYLILIGQNTIASKQYQGWSDVQQNSTEHQSRMPLIGLNFTHWISIA